jgi:hypothetical protein
MKSNSLSRLRASIAGLTFAVAAIVGATVPAIDAAALSGAGPTGFSGTYNAGTNQIDLSWNAVSGADGYFVGVYLDAAHTPLANNGCGVFVDGSTNTSTHFNGITQCAGGGTPVTTPVLSSTTYYFAVAASDSTTNPFTYTNYSYTDVTTPSGVTQTQATAAPGALKAMPVAGVAGSTSDHFALTWDAPTHDPAVTISGYRIEGRVAGSSTWVLAGTTAQTTFDANDLGGTAISRTATYEFRVAAVDSVSGLSANWATDTTSFATGSTNQQQSNNTTPDAPAPAPKAPKTGFTLGLSNPIAVIGIGALAAAILFILGRKLVRR